MISHRKRRRRTPSTTDNAISDLLKPSLDQPENQTRRRKQPNPNQLEQTSPDTEQPKIEQQTRPSESELVSNQIQTLNTAEIDQIRSELIEESFSPLVEPEYWDESHDWSIDDLGNSSDYWHFLGQYE